MLIVGSPRRNGIQVLLWIRGRNGEAPGGGIQRRVVSAGGSASKINECRVSARNDGHARDAMEEDGRGQRKREKLRLESVVVLVTRPPVRGAKSNTYITVRQPGQSPPASDPLRTPASTLRTTQACLQLVTSSVCDILSGPP